MADEQMRAVNALDGAGFGWSRDAQAYVWAGPVGRARVQVLVDGAGFVRTIVDHELYRTGQYNGFAEGAVAAIAASFNCGEL
jgi:hypothetical protein